MIIFISFCIDPVKLLLLFVIHNCDGCKKVLLKSVNMYKKKIKSFEIGGVCRKWY